MIHGIGVDIEVAARVSKAIKRYGASFLDRIFTEREIAYCQMKGNPPQHFAARFAAKEAFSKAIGTGWGGSFRWLDVEILNDEKGKPSLVLHNELGAFCMHFKSNLSLSHTKEYVVAVVVLETLNPTDQSSTPEVL